MSCRYRSITKQFFRKADGVIVMYDITARDTFMAVKHWLVSIEVRLIHFKSSAVGLYSGASCKKNALENRLCSLAVIDRHVFEHLPASLFCKFALVVKLIQLILFHG